MNDKWHENNPFIRQLQPLYRLINHPVLINAAAADALVTIYYTSMGTMAALMRASAALTDSMTLFESVINVTESINIMKLFFLFVVHFKPSGQFWVL